MNEYFYSGFTGDDPIFGLVCDCDCAVSAIKKAEAALDKEYGEGNWHIVIFNKC